MSTTKPTTARAIQAAVRAAGDPRKAAILQGFFKTGPGEYGAGDVFVGIQVPVLRRLAQDFQAADERALSALLASRIHEDRLLALLILVRQFEKGTEDERHRIYRLYTASTDRINNWDLVDLSAPNIAGAWLAPRSRAPLDRWARSRSLWERRIAIVATHAFIRAGEFGDTLRIADRLLGDPHDLIHKAAGWMLREVGKRDVTALEAFLTPRYRAMPRTMLRYAIERFPETRRKAYLRGQVA
jgi:3-methyladenine DNA glycosylase AlkD